MDKDLQDSYLAKLGFLNKMLLVIAVVCLLMLAYFLTLNYFVPAPTKTIAILFKLVLFIFTGLIAVAFVIRMYLHYVEMKVRGSKK